MSTFKMQCVVLREKGYSMNEIMKATGKPKSSVYLHIKDIPLSKERINRYREASGKWIREFALARKGKSVRSFAPFKGWNTDTVSLVAHLLFDGGIYPKRGCVYNNRSKELILHVEKCMHAVYGFGPVRYTNPLTGVLRISYNNVALGIYMKAKVSELLLCVPQLPIALKRDFVQAFFDDEGCVDYRPEKNRRSIRGYQKDTKVLRTIQSLLQEFNIESRVILPNEIVIVGKGNLSIFKKEINFSAGVYMNGNRSNSRWKKHVEKRELLKQAIASFKS